MTDGFSDSTKTVHSPHLNLLYLCIVNQFETRLTALFDMLEQKIGKKDDTAFFLHANMKAADWLRTGCSSTTRRTGNIRSAPISSGL